VVGSGKVGPDAITSFRPKERSQSSRIAKNRQSCQKSGNTYCRSCLLFPGFRKNIIGDACRTSRLFKNNRYNGSKNNNNNND
jgi:hypothetical protein